MPKKKVLPPDTPENVARGERMVTILRDIVENGALCVSWTKGGITTREPGRKGLIDAFTAAQCLAAIDSLNETNRNITHRLLSYRLGFLYFYTKMVAPNVRCVGMSRGA
jgi:hypothetical protein